MEILRDNRTNWKATTQLFSRGGCKEESARFLRKPAYCGERFLPRVNAGAPCDIFMRKIRETGKASLGGGHKAQSSSGTFYHLTQDEYDQMLADPACDTDLFAADAVEILEKKRIDPELAYKVREDSIRQAGLGHWIDM